GRPPRAARARRSRPAAGSAPVVAQPPLAALDGAGGPAPRRADHRRRPEGQRGGVDHLVARRRARRLAGRPAEPPGGVGVLRRLGWAAAGATGRCGHRARLRRPPPRAARARATARRRPGRGARGGALLRARTLRAVLLLQGPLVRGATAVDRG